MNTPHVHAELIKKWADNPSLPVYTFEVNSGKWEPIQGNFIWHPQLEYYVGENPPQRKVIHRSDTRVVPVGTCLVDAPKYYLPALTAIGYHEINANALELHKFLADKGLVFDNPQDAVKVVQAMLDGF